MTAIAVTLGEALVDPIAEILGLAFPPLATFFPKSQLAQALDTATYNFFAQTFAYGGALWNAAFQPIVKAVTDAMNGLFPTLTQIQNAVVQAFATVSIDTTKVTAAIITVIQTQLATAINQAFSEIANVASNITGEVNNYTNFWGTNLEQKILSVKDSLATLSGIAQAQLANIFNLASGIVGTLNNVIRPKLDSILAALGGDIVGALKSVYDQVVSIGISLQKVITDALANLTPQIIAGFASFLDSASSQLNSLIVQSFSSVTTLVGQTLTQLGEIEYYISTEFKFWVGEAAEYIINSLKSVQPVMSGISDLIVNGINTLENDISALAATDQAYYADLSQKISAGWISFEDSLQTQLGGIWAGFQDQIIKPIGQAWDGFTQGLFAQFNDFFAAVGCDANQIANWFGGIFNQISTWIQSLCGKDCQRDISKALPDPFNIITRSLSGVIGVGGGLGLSLTLGEFVHPLKSLGLSRLAAYFWDMADFKTIGGSVLGALNNASTLRPLAYGLNEFFRPNLPDVNDEIRWHFRINSDIENVKLSMRRHGYADYFVDKYIQDIYQPVPTRMVLNMVETQGIPEDWIRDVMKAHYLSPADIEIMINYARRKRLADEFAELKSAYETAYIAGYVDRATYKIQLESIGRSANEVLWAIYAADRKEETARLKEDIDIIVAAFRADNLDQQGFEDDIYKLPLVPAKAQNLVEKELARKRATAKAQRAAKMAKLSVAEILKGYDVGLLNDDDVLYRLSLINYTPGDASLILLVHKTEQAARAADAAEKLKLDAEKAAAKYETDLANEWARFLVAAITYREISADDAKGLISQLPLSDKRLQLYYAEADLNASRPSSAGTADKPKQMREADVYKSLSYMLITYDDALAYLIAKGYSEIDATLLLQLNAPESVPPA